MIDKYNFYFQGDICHMKNIFEEINEVNSKSNLVNVINHLAEDFKENSSEWENITVSEYLEAIAGWIEDNDEKSLEPVDWDNVDLKVIARLLYMGKIYE